jgi:uncharacterized cupredoxin-like copper-binding protein
MKSRIGIAILMAVTAMGAVSCGSDPSDTASTFGGTTTFVTSNKITGSVEEWAVKVSAQGAKVGEVIFAIANFGTIVHEFLVTKTSYEPGKIPIGDNDRFDEADKGITVVDEISEWSVNDAEVLKVNLEAGTYELLCNIEGHYAAGMHTTFTVSS